MKRIFLFLFISGFVLLFTQCKKDDSVFDVYFCTSTNKAEATLTLYIDDENKGILPFLTVKPKCGSDSLLADLIYVQLDAGRYKIKVKDENGVIKIEGTITYKKNSRQSGIGIGGISVEGSGNCDVVDFFEEI